MLTKRIFALSGLVVSASLALALSGCGGGGTLPQAPGGGPYGAGAGSGAVRLHKLRVPIRIFIPRAPRHLSDRRMRPFFVANSTRGIAVVVYVNGGTTPVGSTNSNVASGSPLCQAVTGGRSCTVPGSAPAGSDDFVVKTYDAAPGSNGFTGAKQLAVGKTTKTIAAGAANDVNLTLGGVVAKGAVHLSWPVNPIIDHDVQTVTVSALDADDNIIINDGWFDGDGTAVTFALSSSNDSTGAFTFAPTNIGFASPTSSLTYDSTKATPAQVQNGFTSSIGATPSNGGTEGSATFTLSKPAFTEFQISTASSFPEGIEVGPDNQIWFAESNGGIATIATNATAGTQTSDYSTGITAFASPTMLANGGGLIWFTEYGIGKIGSISPSTHTIHEYATPSCGASCNQADNPFGIVTGPDGNLWFTENSNTYSNIGTFSPSLPTAMVEYPTHTSGAGPSMITVGPDNNLWFTEYNINSIGKMTTSGTASPESVVGSTSAGTIYSGGITTGPGSMLWFAECNNTGGGPTGDRIGTVTTAGTVTELSQLTTPQTNPLGIVQGPDGAIWFAENGKDSIGRMDPTTHSVIEFPTPAIGSAPWGIVKGPDGALWFTENGKNQIGKLQ